MKLVSAAEMRQIEQRVFEQGVTPEALMRDAGTTVAWHIHNRAPGGSVLVLVGPGKNGGDGLLAASTLKSLGRDVSVYLVDREEYLPFTGRVHSSQEDSNRSWLIAQLEQCSVVVDALLGIGRSRPLGPPFSLIIDACNASRNTTLRVALDLPTGVDADTGAVSGPAFRSDVTITFGFCKRGLALSPGSSYTGEIVLSELQIPRQLADDVQVEQLERADVSAILPRRASESNKGSSGRLLLVAGSQDFLGAPALCSSAAYRAGAGLVELAVIPVVQASVASLVPEVIFTRLPEEGGTVAGDAAVVLEKRIEKAKALAIGPGLGLSNHTVDFLKRMLTVVRDAHLDGIVFDADALNGLSGIPEWWVGLKNVVITPHPGEMSRLTGSSISQVQADRVSCAQHYAQLWGITVVLKGAGTVVASPDGDASINPTGGPNLATAGTGDVLTGIVSGFLAQGLSPLDAARAGVYVHGLCGDVLRQEHGDIGTVAGDLPPLLPSVIKSVTFDG